LWTRALAHSEHAVYLSYTPIPYYWSPLLGVFQLRGPQLLAGPLDP
jgi:hypothetical protein